jgi:hypothetical protein
MNRNEIESQVNKFAAEIMPAEWVASFTELELEAKLDGIVFFAAAAGVKSIVDAVVNIRTMMA